MVANVRQGDGELTSPSGDVYQGQFDANKPHGEGTQYMSNGRVYQGNMVRGFVKVSGSYLILLVRLTKANGLMEVSMEKGCSRIIIIVTMASGKMEFR